MKNCPDFSWARVDFPPGSWCSAVYWIWDENHVDSIHDIFKSCLTVKDFSASHAGLGCQVCRKLEGDAARTADPNWPKGYSIPYDITLSV